MAAAQTRGAVSDFLLGPNPRYAEILDRRCVEQLVRRHVAGDAEGNPRLLLAILMLEVWLSSYLPRARAHRRLVAPRRPGLMIRAYAVVTPARDEATNLARLASSLAAQKTRPRPG